MQVAFNRRMKNDWQADLSYTYSFRYDGNTWSQQHVVHNADGTIGFASNQEQLDDDHAQRRPCGRTCIKANGVWTRCPQLSGASGAGKIAAALASDWQIAGVFTGGQHRAVRCHVSPTRRTAANVNITGSPNYVGYITANGDIGSGCSSNQYPMFNLELQGADLRQHRQRIGPNLLDGCIDKTFDLAFVAQHQLGGKPAAHFRLDVFNLFNTVVLQRPEHGHHVRQSGDEHDGGESISTTPTGPSTPHA